MSLDAVASIPSHHCPVIHFVQQKELLMHRFRKYANKSVHIYLNIARDTPFTFMLNWTLYRKLDATLLQVLWNSMQMCWVQFRNYCCRNLIYINVKLQIWSNFPAFFFLQNGPIISRDTGRCLEVEMSKDANFGLRLVVQRCSGQKWMIRNWIKHPRHWSSSTARYILDWVSSSSWISNIGQFREEWDLQC